MTFLSKSSNTSPSKVAVAAAKVTGRPETPTKPSSLNMTSPGMPSTQATAKAGEEKHKKKSDLTFDDMELFGLDSDDSDDEAAIERYERTPPKDEAALEKYNERNVTLLLSKVSHDDRYENSSLVRQHYLCN
jgi:hypothetical protein